MRLRFRSQLRAQALLGTAALLAAAACSGSLASTPPTQSSGPLPSSATRATEPAASASFGRCGSADVFIEYLPYTTATLAGYGWDFVVVDVVSFEAATFNTPNGEAPLDYPKPPSSPHPNPKAQTLVFTPVNVVIDTAISGTWNAGPRQFLIEGGTVPMKSGPVDCLTVRVDMAPLVEPGLRYVFVVSEAVDSEGQPMVLSMARFAWPVDSNGIVVTVDGPISIPELANAVAAAPKPDPNATTGGR